MTAWPAGLPDPELKTYASSDKYNVLRTDMESGPPRQSRLSAHYMTTGSFTLTLSGAQMVAFRAVVPASNYGADWVTGVPLDTGLGRAEHRIRMIKVKHKVLFPQDGLYQVTVNFETDEHE